MLAFAFALPFVLVIVFLLWTFLRRSPEERTKRLFVQIANYARAHPHCSQHFSASVPHLVAAVRDFDLPYLKAFLKNLRRDFP